MSELEQKARFIGKDILFVLRLFAGFVLIIIGTVGLIFPVMPDWILILVGIGFFDTEGKLRKKILKVVPNKYQKSVAKILFYDLYLREKRQRALK